MLLRLLYLFVLSYLFFALLNLILSWVKRQRKLGSQDRSKGAEEMVLDPQCHSYVPKGEVFFRGGHYFCSEDCARVYLSRQGEKDKDKEMRNEN